MVSFQESGLYWYVIEILNLGTCRQLNIVIFSTGSNIDPPPLPNRTSGLLRESRYS